MKTKKNFKFLTCKKIVFVSLIFLLANCAITPRQISSNKEIKKAARLCVEAFPLYNNSYNSSYQTNNYKLITEIKNKYPKEWEEFKKKSRSKANVLYNGTSDFMDDIRSGLFMSVFTLGIAPTFHSIYLITPAKDEKTYPEVLELCDKKIPLIMEEKRQQQEAYEKMKPEIERLKKEERKKQIEIEEEQNKKNQKNKEKIEVVDEYFGLKPMTGPLSGGYYSNVYIKSNTVGIIANGPLMLKNSVIEAPVCIVSNAGGVRVSNSVLNCNLCVEFRSGISFGNVFLWNQCNGKTSNRPDIY